VPASPAPANAWARLEPVPEPVRPPTDLWTIDDVSSVLDHVHLACGVGAARCPAHDDRWGTLAMCEVEPGDIAFHCSGGCAEDSIRQAIASRMAVAA
jgi:hypothetical protein